MTPRKSKSLLSAKKLSKRNGTLSSRKSMKSALSGEYRGYGPLPQPKTGKRLPNNFFQFDDKYFKKMPGEPSLFNLDVDE